MLSRADPAPPAWLCIPLSVSYGTDMASAAKAQDVPAESSVGLRIRQVRAERKWTQDQLAVEVGVSRSAVAQWETDRSGQVRGNLSRIADVLGVSVEFLLHGAASRSPADIRTGDELALLRLYRECDPGDRTFLLRTARKLARSADQAKE